MSRKILIVDDEFFFRAVLTEGLKECAERISEERIFQVKVLIMTASL